MILLKTGLSGFCQGPSNKKCSPARLKLA